MNAGRIEQIGTPDEVHDNPATPFVCGFVGEANRFEGTVSGGRFTSGSVSFAAKGDGPAVAFVRPHDFALDDGGFEVKVVRAHVQGALTAVSAVSADGRHIEISASRAEASKFAGTIKIAARKSHVYPL
jgi:sulfate transport system ATP-binding protein